MEKVEKVGNRYVVKFGKSVKGTVIRERRTFDTKAQAQRHLKFLQGKVNDVFNSVTYGSRRAWTCRELFALYIRNRAKWSLSHDAYHLRMLEPWIGDLAAQSLSMQALSPMIGAMVEDGKSLSTINGRLNTLRIVLNWAARAQDEYGLTYLAIPPKIWALSVVEAQKFGKVKEPLKSYPLSWDEQDRLLSELGVLAEPALFGLYTGCREQIICGLKWRYEKEFEGTGSVFLIPGIEDGKKITKNGKDQVIVLGKVARSLVDKRRQEQNGEYVFHREGRRIQYLNTKLFQRAWNAAGLPVDGVRHGVHNLRHTFGSRLRDAGVDEWTIADLLHHSTKSTTRTYSAPTLARMVSAVDLIQRPQKNSKIFTGSLNTSVSA